MRYAHPALLLLGLCSFALTGRGIVNSGGDVALYRQAPANGAPWQQVAGIGIPEGSGVYLGKRFILTADHVPNSSTVILNGQTYSRDQSFEPVQLRHPNKKPVDLKLIRIVGDPGLAGVPLLGASETDVARRCTVIGWGRGRGDAIGNRGWTWNGERTQRWGTNVTLPYTLLKTSTGFSLPLLATAFHRGAGPDEMSLANSDSGCGLFFLVKGVWKLGGIGVEVDDNEASYYDRDPAKAGVQPGKSYYVRLRPLRASILSIINAAAP